MGRRRSGDGYCQPRRSRPNRPIKRTILIVCEGKETERNYLEGLRHDDSVSVNYSITVKRGSGGTREKIAHHAIDCKTNLREFNGCLCVMDVEHASHRTSLMKSLKLLKQNKIEASLSNPTFEVWLLSHFEDTAENFSDGDAVVERLNRHWKRLFLCDYQKNDRLIYRRLLPYQKNAVKVATRVLEQHHNNGLCHDCNSSTDMFKLILKLLSPPKIRKARKSQKGKTKRPS